jgi:hypothetical protein
VRRYRLSDLGSEGPEHVASTLIPGRRIAAGGLSFHAPGGRTHPEGEHRHDGHEVFCILQGKGSSGSTGGASRSTPGTCW